MDDGYRENKGWGCILNPKSEKGTCNYTRNGIKTYRECKSTCDQLGETLYEIMNDTIPLDYSTNLHVGFNLIKSF